MAYFQPPLFGSPWYTHFDTFFLNFQMGHLKTMLEFKSLNLNTLAVYPTTPFWWRNPKTLNGRLPPKAPFFTPPRLRFAPENFPKPTVSCDHPRKLLVDSFLGFTTDSSLIYSICNNLLHYHFLLYTHRRRKIPFLICLVCSARWDQSGAET